MAIKHICPVCGYEMEYPPVAYNICPSCVHLAEPSLATTM
jgi:hypothetical protein